jgi:nucleotide-binding universal stress UspA family protein
MTTTPHTQTIVVGYVHSAASRHALTTAADLARDLGAHLHVVHVVDLADYPVDPDLPDWEAEVGARLDAAQADAERLLADWPEVSWRFDLRRGDPAHALAEEAGRDHARLIVVGTRGGARFVTALERLLGASRSVAHALEAAQVPVLVVPTPRRETS